MTATTSTTTAANTDTDLDDDDRDRVFSTRHTSRRGSGTFTRGGGGGYTSSSSSDLATNSNPYYLPTSGYATHYADGYALPSIPDQRVARYRERVLQYATWGCFGAAYALMGIAGVLILTGKHKMRLEVDAGATVGIMSSLGAACAGLCMTGSRRDRVGWVGRVGVWMAFAVVCVVNGVLLVLVMGNASRV